MEQKEMKEKQKGETQRDERRKKKTNINKQQE